MKVGDRAQYNKIYKPQEVVIILKIEGDKALIHFSTGEKICTRLSALWPLDESTEELESFQDKQLKIF